MERNLGITRVSGNKVAVVTGAAGAIGYEITKLLLAQSHTVVLLDKSSAVKECADALRAEGHNVAARQVDLADLQDVEAVAADLLAEFGRVDILVNNAGMHPMKSDGALLYVEDIDTASWELTMMVNLTAPFLLCRRLLPGMKANGWGRIVNIASRAGRAYSSGSSASYSASKAGLIGMTRTIAGEYARFGITANVVAPGRTETPLMLSQSEEVQEAGLAEIPRRKVGQPAEIAAAVQFLVSEGASNVVGSIIDVNGGTHMP